MNKTEIQRAALPVTVTPEDSRTLHKFLRARFPTLIPSRRQALEAVAAGQVAINGSTIAAPIHNTSSCTPPTTTATTTTIASVSTDSIGISVGTVDAGAVDATAAPELKIGDTVSVTRTAEDVTRRAAEAVDVNLCADFKGATVFWKAAGVSMAAPAFLDTLRTRMPPSVSEQVFDAMPMQPLNLLAKADSGLILVAKLKANSPANTSNIDSTDTNISDIQLVYRCMVHGRAGLAKGDQFTLATPLQDAPDCSTRFTVVSFTRTRNASDGFLTTLDATPLKSHAHKQVLGHLFASPNPVIGNSRLAKQHRTCRDKGMFLSLISISFVDSDGQRCLVTHPEPTKFEALRKKEEKFFLKKQDEIDAAVRDSKKFKSDDGNHFEENASRNLDCTNGGNSDIANDTISSIPKKSFMNPAYIRQEAEFRGFKFKVTPSVMIPRQSSSVLVDRATALFSQQHHNLNQDSAIRVLDMGTGSASLIISTVKHLEFLFPTFDPARITGIAFDASSSALAVSRENIIMHNLATRIETKILTFGKVASLFSNSSTPSGAAVEVPLPINILLCNPPYLSPTSRKIASIDKTMLDEEPPEALYAGSSQFEAYHEIADGILSSDSNYAGGNGAYRVFARGCVFAVEIGHGMAEKVQRIFQEKICAVSLSNSSDCGDGFADSDGKRWRFVELGRDFRGLERCLVYEKIF
ncbi:hypothetical protein HK100_000791 [Physocladia obscura]|uniref:S-adenosyl-L-methionine-dependent methyltransferase n=1 Tax=Physocladia obscura TaxID=109957 RepID=A0AAD5XJT4_9FUNG|nr:hypothetical protein HK100_000791 [Physocladia obscura]